MCDTGDRPCRKETGCRDLCAGEDAAQIHNQTLKRRVFSNETATLEA